MWNEWARTAFFGQMPSNAYLLPPLCFFTSNIYDILSSSTFTTSTASNSSFSSFSSWAWSIVKVKEKTSNFWNKVNLKRRFFFKSCLFLRQRGEAKTQKCSKDEKKVIKTIEMNEQKERERERGKVKKVKGIPLLNLLTWS